MGVRGWACETPTCRVERRICPVCLRERLPVANEPPAPHTSIVPQLRGRGVRGGVGCGGGGEGVEVGLDLGGGGYRRGG